MSRTTLCSLTAAGLAILSLGVMAARYAALGGEVKTPAGPSTWKVTLVVRGEAHGDARIITSGPLDVGRQHVLKEDLHSPYFTSKSGEAKRPDRRSTFWTRRPGQVDGPVRVRCEYYVSLDVAYPNSAMTKAANGLYGAPHPGEHLDRADKTTADSTLVADKARELTETLEKKGEMAEALYRFVDADVPNDPSIDGPAVGAGECLRNGSGDPTAKARLLTALLRQRGVPARMVMGLTLQKGPEQRAHTWVEAWLADRWVSMDPFHHH